MNVYIANFGRGNWAWPECLKTSTLVVIDDERVHPFWLRNDREPLQDWGCFWIVKTVIRNSFFPSIASIQTDTMNAGISR